MCIVLPKDGLTRGHFSLSPITGLPMVGRNQMVECQIPNFCLFCRVNKLVLKQ